MRDLVKNNLAPTSFSDLFDRFFHESVNTVAKATNFVPLTDVFETDEAYHIELSVPGVQKEDFSVEVNEGVLTISGERKKEERTAHRVESFYGRFERTFKVPEKAKADKVHAKYEDGILKVELPKDEEKTKKYNVSVN